MYKEIKQNASNNFVLTKTAPTLIRVDVDLNFNLMNILDSIIDIVSTSSALLKIFNDLHTPCDQGKNKFLAILDFAKAFDNSSRLLYC